VAADAAANTALIEAFYAALGRRDAEAMIACYAPDARFSIRCSRTSTPPASPRCADALRPRQGPRGRRVGHRRRRDGRRAHWVATYTYSATGPRREPHRCDLRVRDGRSRGIATASISIAGRGRRWARRACCSLAAPVQGAIRRQAAAALAAWREKMGSGPDLPVGSRPSPGNLPEIRT